MNQKSSSSLPAGLGLIPLESSETVCQIPTKSLLEKIQSELQGDMQRVAEMSTPLRKEASLSG
jgi:hypothetical protein